MHALFIVQSSRPEHWWCQVRGLNDLRRLNVLMLTVRCDICCVNVVGCDVKGC